VQRDAVTRNDRSRVARTDRVPLSSDVESSSVTDDSDVDVIMRNKCNSHRNTTR